MRRPGTSHVRSIAFLVTTWLSAVILVTSGVLNISRWEFFSQILEQQLGYPAYFTQLLGVWKVLGGLAIVWPRTPRLKEWAYAGAMFTCSGAVISHFAVGTPADAILPFAVGLATLTSWSLRPADRRTDVFTPGIGTPQT